MLSAHKPNQGNQPTPFIPSFFLRHPLEWLRRREEQRRGRKEGGLFPSSFARGRECFIIIIGGRKEEEEVEKKEGLSWQPASLLAPSHVEREEYYFLAIWSSLRPSFLPSLLPLLFGVGSSLSLSHCSPSSSSKPGCLLHRFMEKEEGPRFVAADIKRERRREGGVVGPFPAYFSLLLLLAYYYQAAAAFGKRRGGWLVGWLVPTHWIGRRRSGCCKERGFFLLLLLFCLASLPSPLPLLLPFSLSSSPSHAY